MSSSAAKIWAASTRSITCSALTEDGGDHVFTLHAELEGGAYLEGFERLLKAWRARGIELTDLGSYARALDVPRLPRCPIVSGTVPGRSGTLALQGGRGLSS